MSEESKKVVVCVTGATGYIASWIVKLLLERNYTVHATVRDPNDETKVEHLLRLDGAKERLKLFKSNLLEEGSFDSAISGCHGVFHTASPVLLTTTNPQEYNRVVELHTTSLFRNLLRWNHTEFFVYVQRFILTIFMLFVLLSVVIISQCELTGGPMSHQSPRDDS